MQRYALRKIGSTQFTKTIEAASLADAVLWASANGFDHTRIDCLGTTGRTGTTGVPINAGQAQERLAATMQRLGGLSEAGGKAAAAGRGATSTQAVPIRELAAQHRSGGAGTVELREQSEKKLAAGLGRLGLSEAGASAGAKGR